MFSLYEPRLLILLLKSLLYGELAEGARPVGRLKLRYKDTSKNALKCGEVLDHWKTKVETRSEWRQIRQTCQKVNVKRANAYEKQRETRRRHKNTSDTLLLTFILYLVLTIYCVCVNLCYTRYSGIRHYIV